MIDSLVFYTGLPSYDCFATLIEYLQPKAALIEYLQPKAATLTSWNGRNTKEVLEKEIRLVHRPLAGLTVADQLFSVLIQLRCS